MLLCTNLALAEMAVLYPVNGAFYTYIVRLLGDSLVVGNMPFPGLLFYPSN